MIKTIKNEFGDSSFLLDVKIIGEQVFYTIVAKANTIDVFFGPAIEKNCSIDEFDSNLLIDFKNIIENNKEKINLIDNINKKEPPKIEVKVQENTKAEPVIEPTFKKPKRTLKL